MKGLSFLIFMKSFCLILPHETIAHVLKKKQMLLKKKRKEKNKEKGGKTGVCKEKLRAK